MKHELTAKQRESLRRTLEDKRRELLRDIDRREQDTTEGQVESSEVEDVAEGVIEDRDRAALLERDRWILAEVEHALAKMDAGTYGRSEMSGQPIPYARLRAVPWARHEADEAERIEHEERR